MASGRVPTTHSMLFIVCLFKIFGLRNCAAMSKKAKSRVNESPAESKELPKAEQRIYFANHQSHADLVMTCFAAPFFFRSARW